MKKYTYIIFAILGLLPVDVFAAADATQQPEERTSLRLINASEGGDLEEVDCLLAAGATVNIASGPFKKIPLCVAAEAGHDAVVERLLAAGADMEVRDDSGKTAADFAREMRQDNIVKLFEKERTWRRRKLLLIWREAELLKEWSDAERADAAFSSSSTAEPSEIKSQCCTVC